MARTPQTQLDERGRLFCVEMAKGGHSAYQAAIKAGFTESTSKFKAAGWLKKPLFIAEINRLRGIVGDVIDARLKEAAAKKPRQKREAKPAPPPLPPAGIKPVTPDVDAAIRAHAERVAAAAAKVDISMEWVLKELVANHYRATLGEKPNLGASARCLELIGIQIGGFVRKSHVEFKDISTMTPEEAQAETAKALAELGGQLPPELLSLFATHQGSLQ